MNQTLPHYSVAGRLAVEIHLDRAGATRAAARSCAAYLRDVIAEKGHARVIFACAPSQTEFLAALIDPSISGVALPWSRVTGFHMDDYVGLTGAHPASFRNYIRQHLLTKVALARFNPIPAEESDSAAVCANYARLLSEGPIDLICLGVGENGHIAFNDPPVADLDDPALIKLVELDAACRTQQVNDGCFPSFETVPQRAYTLTIPIFRQARRLSCHVFGPLKANAVRAMLQDPVSTRCPATILRQHPSAMLYVDAGAAKLL